MQAPVARTSPRRSGFTLVELLVVILIMMVLLGVVAMATLSFRGPQRTAQGADDLQGWLLIAKQRAKRDGAVRGIRLYVDPSTNYVTQMAYIEQPDDFVAHNTDGTVRPVSATGTTTLTPVAAAGNGAPTNTVATALTSTVTLASGTGSDFSSGGVQPLDYIEFNGGGTLYQITAVSSATTLTVSPVPPTAVSSTTVYRVIRAPQVIAGETPLQLPGDIVIDLTTNGTYSNPVTPSGSTTTSSPVASSAAGANAITSTTTQQYVDILFAPSGAVVNSPTGNDKIILWVRNQTLSDPANGDPRLITVYVHTGFIAAYPVDPTPSSSGTPPLQNPYSLTQSGQSSGL